MPTNPKSMTDKDIEEFEEKEEERGRYPTEAEEFGGKGADEYIVIQHDPRPFSERIIELESLLEIYEAILEDGNKSEAELRTKGGNILQKYNNIKNDLQELAKNKSKSDKAIAKEFQARMNEINSTMERLGI